MSSRKGARNKFFTTFTHTASSGVVGEVEYEVFGENALRVVSDFTTSGTLTVQGRIKHSASWDALGTLAAAGATDEFDIGSYDFIRFNFTVTAGSTGSIVASGFFKGSSGSAGAATAFTIVQTDAGTSPTSDSITDTLTLTSSDASLTVTGNSTTDTVDLIIATTPALESATTTVNVASATAPTTGQVLTATAATTATWQTPSVASGDVAGPASSVDNAIARFSGTTGKIIQDYTSGAPTFSDTGSLTLNGGGDTISSAADLALSLDSTGNNGFATNGSGNNLAIFNNNAQAMYFTTSQIRTSLVFALGNGSVSAPSIGYLGMTNGGQYRDSGTDSLRMAVNGVDSQIWDDDYSSVAKVFGVGQYATGSLPTASSWEGFIAYDTTSQTMKWSNGTAWATI